MSRCLVGTVTTVCGTRSMQLSGVRPSVCPSVSPSFPPGRRCCGFAAVGPIGRRCQSSCRDFDYWHRPELHYLDSLWLCFGHNTHTRLTAFCPGLPGWAGTRKVKPIWILLKQETVSYSGISWAICKSAPCFRQIPHQHPIARFLKAECRQSNSVKALRHTAVRTQQFDKSTTDRGDWVGSSAVAEFLVWSN